MVTIYDIAKKANVSPMTVSRVINNSAKTTETTRKKVESAIQELGYIPNTAARSLVSKSTNLVSLLITDITNPFFTKVARGAEDKANQMGLQLILSNSDEDSKKEADYIDMLISRNVDGVLLAPTGNQSKDNIKKLIKYNIPFVLIDREVKGIESDIVLGDNYEGSRKLVKHLIELGHRKIALINGPQNISTAYEREKGYIETLKLNGISINKNIMAQVQFNKNDHRSIYTIVENLLSLPKQEVPTAIFAGNNFIAGTVINALKHFGLKLPEDMSVVCFDELEPFFKINNFLTSAIQPAYSFGYTGIQFLIERISGTIPKNEYRRVTLSPDIVYNESSQRLN